MTIFQEGYVLGLQHSKQMAELHKKYSQDIDYLISTLETLIKKENSKSEETKDK